MLTLPYGWEHTSVLPALAPAYGLSCYDPQSGELLRPDLRSRDEPRPSIPRADHGVDAVAIVDGWVAEDHVVEMFRQISALIGYEYDDLDEAALVGALDGTDDESADAWFRYPLAGTPALMVHLAHSLGSAVVSVRVEGAMGRVLAAQVETILDVL